jgi:hypothetical protein
MERHSPFAIGGVAAFRLESNRFSFHAMQASDAGLRELGLRFKGRCRHFDVCRYHVDRFLQDMRLKSLRLMDGPVRARLPSHLSRNSSFNVQRLGSAPQDVFQRVRPVDSSDYALPAQNAWRRRTRGRTLNGRKGSLAQTWRTISGSPCSAH